MVTCSESVVPPLLRGRSACAVPVLAGVFKIYDSDEMLPIKIYAENSGTSQAPVKHEFKDLITVKANSDSSKAPR